MSKYPYQITGSTVTVLVNGRTYAADRSNKAATDEIVKALADPNTEPEALVDLFNVANALNAAVDAAVAEIKPQYLTKGVIKVTRNGVTFNGAPLHNSLADKLVEIASLGLPIGGWVRFAENLYQNPSESAREELFDWLSGADTPITGDGHFIAYKIVGNDYKDLYTSTFDNSVGQVVELENREAVDSDRHNVCSHGLHFCSRDYLPNYGNVRNGGTDRIVLVKINPADVVSIPMDYNHTKGRTWRYEVVGEIEYTEVFGDTPTWTSPIVDDYDYDDEYDEEWEDEDDEETFDGIDDLDEDLEDLEDEEEAPLLDPELEKLLDEEEEIDLRNVLNNLSLRDIRSRGSKAGLGKRAWKELRRQAIVDYIVAKHFNRPLPV